MVIEEFIEHMERLVGGDYVVPVQCRRFLEFTADATVAGTAYPGGPGMLARHRQLAMWIFLWCTTSEDGSDFDAGH